MLNKLVSFNNKHQLFSDKNKLILATSGGIDSMVLLDLLKNLDVELIIAHCNFNLREKESDADQALVKRIAEQNKLVFQTINFETENYAKDNKLSIEEAARDLRYDWFEKIRKELKANLIVTAHHLNDNSETLLFNLTKGTGIKGLRGMLPKREKIVRPLLNISREEIEKYASENKIEYREDASNNSLEYSRNLIRKNVIPELNKVNLSFLKTQAKHFERFRDIELFYNDAVANLKKDLFKEKKGDFYLSINKLLKHKGFRTLLFEILKEYSFSNYQVDDILELIINNKAVSGKTFFSKTHRIIKDRKHLILSVLNNETADLFDLQQKNTKIKLPNEEMIRIHLKPIEKLTKMSNKNHYAYLDFDKLEFPLVLRKWEDGDYFYPFGMYRNGKAKKKKIKKYFSDLKLSIVDKENVWILTSGEKIVWVVNHRIDDRFKVNNKTKNVYQLKFVECKN
ncbi:MAG: tRNA(Ile)-lysidine synthase [Planctomycetota bacterium]|jgi:tRNA(Ile)-lysidine synthase